MARARMVLWGILAFAGLVALACPEPPKVQGACCAAQVFGMAPCACGDESPRPWGQIVALSLPPSPRVPGPGLAWSSARARQTSPPAARPLAGPASVRAPPLS